MKISLDSMYMSGSLLYIYSGLCAYHWKHTHILFYTYTHVHMVTVFNFYKINYNQLWATLVLGLAEKNPLSPQLRFFPPTPKFYEGLGILLPAGHLRELLFIICTGHFSFHSFLVQVPMSSRLTLCGWMGLSFHPRLGCEAFCWGWELWAYATSLPKATIQALPSKILASP